MDTRYEEKYKEKDDESKEKMNIQLALDLLDIDTLRSGNYSNLTNEYVKRKYHKMALRFHPDKNGNTIESTKQFQKISEAYIYLVKELELDISSDNIFVSSKENEDDTRDDTNMYTTILSVFLSGILKVSSNMMSELLINVIKDIVINGYKVISIKLIDELDKEMSLELYNFLNKYKHVLYIDTESLELVSSLIKEKYKNDRVYILNPSIDDILDNNIYKLYVDEQLYLVPLWHNELYFEDPNKNDIIVLCNAELPENVTIDEHNNIHCNLLVAFEKEMVINQQRMANSLFNELSVAIGKHIYVIPFSQLYMKKEQRYVIKGQGISNIFENDIYNQNNSGKCDIIVNILFN